MKFNSIFDVFSRRNKQTEPFIYNIPTTLRNKILLFCRDTFSNRDNPYGSGDYTKSFWEEVHQMLQYRHGRLQLVDELQYPTPAGDSISFLLSCNDEYFLDFIEYIFRVRCIFHVTDDENELVSEINKLIASESLGYELTEIIKEKRIEDTYFGRGREVIVTIAYPHIIRKDSQTIHNTTIKPVLQLLSDPMFKTANQEYLESLEDYRKGDYGDSLTKCCSAFESVMKIICDKKGWKYSQTDTAAILLKTIIQKAKLELHFQLPLLYVATLRNKYSKSHGAGVTPKKVTQNIALLGLNLSASAILFLTKEI